MIHKQRASRYNQRGTTSGNGSKPLASRPAPGRRLDPTPIDRAIVERREADISAWREGGLTNSKIAQRLRVRVGAVEELVEIRTKQQAAGTALAPVGGTLAIPVACALQGQGPYVPRFRETAPVPPDLYWRFVRGYYDTNQLLEPEARFASPWEFVEAQLDELEALRRDHKELEVRFEELQLELDQAHQKEVELEADLERWAVAYRGKEAEISQLSSNFHQALSTELYLREAGWRRLAQRNGSERAMMLTTLDESRKVGLEERRKKEELEGLFTFLCRENGRLKMELASIESLVALYQAQIQRLQRPKGDSREQGR